LNGLDGKGSKSRGVLKRLEEGTGIREGFLAFLMALEVG
jgi:hypothetical protein